MSVHLQNDLEKLKQSILDIGILVEDTVEKSMKAFRKREVDLAKEVIADDEIINQREVEIEEECLKLLALYQPVAEDLRFITSVVKMNNDLERMGDCSVKIAKRTLSLSKEPPIEIPLDIEVMIKEVKSMVKDCLDAFFNKDTTFAREICVRDDRVDALHRKVIKDLRSRMHESPNEIDQLLDLITAAQGLERIADLATNIAQDVVYMVEGDIIRHQEDQYPRKS
ncbi:MAG: phosphate signaling complex protein PhoU [Bdellovibrionales bacterium]|nr:phosphate signaling complex protein PhoU [Bdellovibrionales bacterium]